MDEEAGIIMFSDNVTAIQTQITEMGYEANSNAEWIESNQKTMGYVQAVLGGIGAGRLPSKTGTGYCEGHSRAPS